MTSIDAQIVFEALMGGLGPHQATPASGSLLTRRATLLTAAIRSALGWPPGHASIVWAGTRESA